MSDPQNQHVRHTWKSVGSTIYYHAKTHTGVGVICSVAYFDPGNWGVDLQAGSEFGYKLLFVVLLASLFAAFLQVLACRLGCVTGLDLASHCRLLLHDRPRHTLLYRWLALYPIYVLTEIAIISTDLAELLGSAIALCLIFPRLPLWAGVLITGLDVLFILTLGNPLGGRPLKMFEYLIAGLVFAILICIIIIISNLHIDWGDAFLGFLPSKSLISQNGLYTSVGIVGATVMPHSLILGSALATQDRISAPPPRMSDSSHESENGPAMTTRCRLRLLFNKLSVFRIQSTEPGIIHPRSHLDHENNPLAFVKDHLHHAIVDVAVFLLGFAIVINALILILAGSVFYDGGDDSGPATLFDAHDLIRDRIGKAAGLLFAFSLLASGQSASLIATVAGQAVSEGFLRWKVSPVLRRLVTRLLGLIPSMAVAIVVGRNGLSALLVLSQVILSIILPFIVLPLIYLTTSKKIMRVRRPPRSLENKSEVQSSEVDRAQVIDLEGVDDTVDFSNGKFVAGLAYTIWALMIVANVYVLSHFGQLGV